VSRAKTTPRRRVSEELGLWVWAFVPVLAWIAAQQIDFFLAPWVCATGHRWALYAVTGSAFLAAAAAGFLSLLRWRRSPPRDEKGNFVYARRRFMVAGGLLLAAVSLVAILALAIPALVHRPCD
jgi:hypothetical protein